MWTPLSMNINEDLWTVRTYDDNIKAFCGKEIVNVLFSLKLQLDTKTEIELSRR